MSLLRLLPRAGQAGLAAAPAVRFTSPAAARSFGSSLRRMDVAPVAVPVKKPVGAFRGGLFGFLLGTVGAGASMYYYVLSEYKLSNDLLTEDIFALQQAVQRLEGYVKVLEEKSEAMLKKK